MIRYGKQNSGYGLIDSLTLTYNGNQLKKVTDTASDPLYLGAFHFQDGGNVAVEYLYDTNGNMTVDYNKKISKIQYNQLNLPNKLQFTYGHTTSYRYGADGTKRNVTHVTSTTNLLVPMGSIVAVPANQIASTMQTDYCGNLIYENGVLSKILTEEGYITLNGTTPVHYYLKDHQVNNRVVIDQSGVVEQVNHYYPFGMTYGDGIATSNQPYKYNDKELDRMHGLDWYDYGARMYDSALGRFHTQDRFVEKYFPLSPYQYAANNPVCNIDVNGDNIWVSVVNTTTDANGNTNTTKSRYYYGQNSNGNYGFLDASGNIYSGNDKFVGQLTTALGDLRQGGSSGAGLVNDLMTSTNNTEVVSRGGNKADSQNGAYILWNPIGTNGGPYQNGGNTRPSFIGLGHEMAHVQDVWNRTVSNNTWVTVTLPNGQTQSIPYAEIYSTHMENQIRSENNVPLRVSYGINAIGGADPSTRIIRAGTSQSIYYNQNGVTNYSPLKRKQTPFTY